jgi:hypothetical protein
MLDAHTPWWLLVCIGPAASSPCTMLAKPGIARSPPELPLHRTPTSRSVMALVARHARTASAAMNAAEKRVAPCSSIA